MVDMELVKKRIKEVECKEDFEDLREKFSMSGATVSNGNFAKANKIAFTSLTLSSNLIIICLLDVAFFTNVVFGLQIPGILLIKI